MPLLNYVRDIPFLFLPFSSSPVSQSVSSRSTTNTGIEVEVEPSRYHSVSPCPSIRPSHSSSIYNQLSYLRTFVSLVRSFWPVCVCLSSYDYLFYFLLLPPPHRLVNNNSISFQRHLSRLIRSRLILSLYTFILLHQKGRENKKERKRRECRITSSSTDREIGEWWKKTYQKIEEKRTKKVFQIPYTPFICETWTFLISERKLDFWFSHRTNLKSHSSF